MNIQIREVQKPEYDHLGRLMVAVYARIADFPTPEQQPQYYEMLANIWQFTQKKATKVLVAVTPSGELTGGVVYFGDMKEYGSGGTATGEKNASGIRLLAVDDGYRGMGIGKALTQACIDLASKNHHEQVILHTTEAMQAAWALYLQLGFERSEDLDFMQASLAVFGFRLRLDQV